MTHTMNAGDTVFATLTTRGDVVATARFSDAQSMQQIYMHMRRLAPHTRGLATIDVRNPTQGWAISQKLCWM